MTKVSFTSKATAKVPILVKLGKQKLRNPGKPQAVIISNTSKTDPLTLGLVRVSGSQTAIFRS